MGLLFLLTLCNWAEFDAEPCWLPYEHIWFVCDLDLWPFYPILPKRAELSIPKSIQHFFENVFCSLTLTFEPTTYKNVISSWLEYRKYLWIVWLKSLHWVHDLLVCTRWPWPLTLWPSQCHQCHPYLLVINPFTADPVKALHFAILV